MRNSRRPKARRARHDDPGPMIERFSPGSPPPARTVVAACSLWLACGCVARGKVDYHFAVPSDRGQSGEQKLTPQIYGGYELLGRCIPIAWTQHRMTLRGQGSRRVIRPLGTGWDDEMLALRLRAQKALGSVAQAVWYEDSACHRGQLALTAIVGTYSQIDPALEILGEILRDEHLGDYADVVLVDPGPNGETTYDATWKMPLARRTFFPYELSLAAGARHEERWDPAVAIHLGVAWGREDEPPSKAGWFWGLGADGQLAFGDGATHWSLGPSARFGRAFGSLEPDRPAPATNRGSYVYAQTAAEWGTHGPVMVLSLGLTSLAFAEWILRRHDATGNAAYAALLPLALLNHVEVGWELDTSTPRYSTVSVLLGFSL